MGCLLVKKTRYLACALALVVVAWPLATPVASPRCYPSSRLEVLAGGLVRDTLTQLVWQRDGSGTRTGCSGTGALTCTLAEATSYCASLGSGFRLPTVKELASLVDLTVTSGPTINQAAFPGTPAESFWTSTRYDGVVPNPYFVRFGDGSFTTGDVRYDYRVRCVR
jgi:hypothetical protein